MSTNSNEFMKKKFLLFPSLLLVCSSALVGCSGKAFGVEVQAGSIWNNNHAREICPPICELYGWRWTQHWHKTPWRRMSVCSCGEWRLDKSKAVYANDLRANEQANFDIFRNAIANRGLHPIHAAREVEDCNYKHLDGDRYQIRISQRYRVFFTVDEPNKVVTILQVGGHT